jgi:hypothetical protein
MEQSRARPAVSVVMAAFNGQRYLPAQLASILDELQPGDELVVVDDASTDATAALLAACAAPCLRVSRNPRNAGVRVSFERGLRLARHDLILLADQDDVWLPGKRDTLVAALTSSQDVALALSDAQVIDGDGRLMQPSFMSARGGFRGGILSTLVKNRYLGCTMALRRCVLARALPFPDDIPMHDMWLGAIARTMGRVIYLDQPLIQYRRHGGNASPARPASWQQMARWRWSLLRNLVVRMRAPLRPVTPPGPEPSA